MREGTPRENVWNVFFSCSTQLSASYADYSARPSIKASCNIASLTRLNAATISPNLICLRPTSNIRTMSPGLFGMIACRVAMMIVAKNAAITICQKARGPGNFVNAADQTFWKKLSTSHISAFNTAFFNYFLQVFAMLLQLLFLLLFSIIKYPHV